jgi:16S rRNA (cytidine1402-2'-O)-methyltransferase
MENNLYIVATPIGNLEDITLRAIRILKEVDIVAAEDTRHTHILLDHYQIKNRLIYFREAADRKKVDSDIDYIISEIQSGKSIAYVSDAGTPGLSDPGQYLVRRVIEAGIVVVPIPGPSALATAISIAGFHCQNVLFLGFLPKKKGRQTLLANLSSSQKIYDAIVFYENALRLVRTIDDFEKFEIKIEQIVVCREITKLHEQILRGSAQEVKKYFVDNPSKLKGEVTVVIKNSK